MALNPAIRQLVIDFLCLVIVWLPILLLDQLGNAYKRGFYCDDDSIRYPFRESTVTNVVLYIAGVGLPIVTMVAVELVRSLSHSRSEGSTKRTAYRTESIAIGSVRLPGVVIELAHLIAIFLFGAGCSQLATDIGKYSIGRLRPHFLDVCKPADFEKLCGISSIPLHRYITSFECTGTDAAKIRDSRLSFPSGHSSFSAYTMLYLALYLQGRMKWTGSYLLRPLLQISALMLTWYTGLSRVSDYKHHWSDVLSGFLIGIISASLTAVYVSNLFTPKKESTEPLLPQTHADIGLVNQTNASSN